MRAISVRNRLLLHGQHSRGIIPEDAGRRLSHRSPTADASLALSELLARHSRECILWGDHGAAAIENMRKSLRFQRLASLHADPAEERSLQCVSQISAFRVMQAVAEA